MQTLHTINIAIHVLFGTTGLLVGLAVMLYRNRSLQHKRYGRYFMYLLTVVVATAFLGILFFRSDPFLVMLTLLSGYVGYSGYRAVQLRERKTSGFDMLVALAVLVWGGLYLRSMQMASENWSPSVIYPTLLALILVAGYDVAKHFWLYQRLKTGWVYEHIYKMMSAYSALASAFAGNVFPQFKPYSQILPSILGMSLIIFFIWEYARKKPAPVRDEQTVA